MKKFILSIILINAIIAEAQVVNGITGDSNWTKNWTNFKSKTAEYNDSSVILSGQISQNMTLYKKEIYLLTGVVYITNNATLTIEPGTLIKGDFATNGTLVIAKGSKIIAKGEETNPIVFTSSKPASERKSGDWGGLIVFGDAPVNRFGSIGQLKTNLDSKFNNYGGENPAGDSGILKYIRVEFAGKKVKGASDSNGLTLGGVGQKTIIDNIQVSYSNDNSFNFYGGNLNLSNLISFRSNGNDFHFSEGTQSNIKNSLAIKNPFYQNPGKSRCILIDSYEIASNANLNAKLTKVVAANITLVNEENDNIGLTKEAIYVRENCNLSLSNSIISGFKQCAIFESKIKVVYENLEKVKFDNVIFNNCNGYIESELVENNAALKNWYNNEKFLIQCSKTNNISFFMDNDVKKLPDFRMRQTNISTSKLASN
jgi:hypothetical protein